MVLVGNSYRKEDRIEHSRFLQSIGRSKLPQKNGCALTPIFPEPDSQL